MQPKIAHREYFKTAGELRDALCRLNAEMLNEMRIEDADSYDIRELQVIEQRLPDRVLRTLVLVAEE